MFLSPLRSLLQRVSECRTAARIRKTSKEWAATIDTHSNSLER
jgi:hypothetical protein